MRLDTTRVIRWELPFLAQSVRQRDWDGARLNLHVLDCRLRDAVARDVAQALPRRVVKMAVVRAAVITMQGMAPNIEGPTFREMHNALDRTQDRQPA